MRRKRLRAGLAVLGLVCMISCGRRDPLPGFPRVMLWAWERPERLGFLDPKAAGAAFLARSVAWKDGVVTSRPRYQPLEVPPGTVTMAVTRLESRSRPLPDADSIAHEIAQTAGLPHVRAVEVDFDARESEREWYSEVLHSVRQRLDASVPLTITSLASWCMGDPWIRALPVKDAVPMLFRMGPGEPKEVTDFAVEVCRSSVGVSTDELPYAVPRGRRLFVFHPRPWTAEAYRNAMQLARRWQ